MTTTDPRLRACPLAELAKCTLKVEEEVEEIISDVLGRARPRGTATLGDRLFKVVNAGAEVSKRERRPDGPFEVTHARVKIISARREVVDFIAKNSNRNEGTGSLIWSVLARTLAGGRE